MGTTASRMSTILTTPPFRRKPVCSASLQYRPQFPDIFYLFQLEQSFNELRELRRPEDRHYQIAAFGNNFLAGHGILGSTANIVDSLGEVRSIDQLQLHNCHAQRHEAF